MTEPIKAIDPPPPLPLRPAEPVVDANAGAEFNLVEMVRLVCIGMPDEDPRTIAAAVVANVPPDAFEAAFLQAVRFICRQYQVRTPREPRPEPQARPQPTPAPEPATGTPRKVEAGAALASLPQHLNDRVNVGSVRDPQWKALGDCTAADLVDAIEVRRDLQRANANAIEFFAAVLDVLVEHRTARRVRDLVGQRQTG